MKQQVSGVRAYPRSQNRDLGHPASSWGINIELLARFTIRFFASDKDLSVWTTSLEPQIRKLAISRPLWRTLASWREPALIAERAKAKS